MKKGSNVTELSRADVFSGTTRAGVLERTVLGSRFTAEPAFLTLCLKRGWGLGFQMPIAQVVDTAGVNLHPFLAGLLPEGLRFDALRRSVKTSEDDLFSLLLKAGADTIGDVRVFAPGSNDETAEPIADLTRLDELSFEALFDQSLDYSRDGRRHSVPGVQAKISAQMMSLPVRLKRGPRGLAILKLEPASLPRLVANEAFFMKAAESCGVRVAHSEVVRDSQGVEALAVTRFDREPRTDAPLHCEDGCQLTNRYPADKYRLPIRALADAVRQFCSAPAIDLVRLLELVAFSYLIGNGDLHARNISVLVGADGTAELSPAYDLLSTLPYGDRRMALKVDGRDDNLKRAHFIDLGLAYELRAKPIEQMIDRLCDGIGPFIERLDDIGFVKRKADDLTRVMRKRRDELRAR